MSRAPELEPDLSSIATNVHKALATVAEQQGVPDIEVTLIWATDFVATTQEVMDAASPNDDSVPIFDLERLGGIVAAKNIPLNEDSSQVAIVINTESVRVAVGELTVGSIFLLAHELTHPILNRMRSSLGLLDEVIYPSETPTELARSITRGAVDEYHADIIASIVLGLFASGEQDGQKIALNQAGGATGDLAGMATTEVAGAAVGGGVAIVGAGCGALVDPTGPAAGRLPVSDSLPVNPITTAAVPPTTNRKPANNTTNFLRGTRLIK